MTKINNILSKITILYYIFIVVLVVDFAYSSTTGFIDGFSKGQHTVQEMAENNNSNILLITTWGVLTVGVYAWTLVLFTILLVSLGKSIAKQNIFNPRTIKLINRFAVVYAISLLMIFCGQFIEETAVIELQEMINGILSGASTIMMLLLFAQVLRIGQILKAETDLTI